MELGREILTHVGFRELAADEEDALLQAFATDLRDAVGERIASLLTAHQLEEFQSRSAGEERPWLEEEFPLHAKVVEAERELLVARWRHRLAMEEVWLAIVEQRRRAAG